MKKIFDIVKKISMLILGLAILFLMLQVGIFVLFILMKSTIWFWNIFGIF